MDEKTSSKIFKKIRDKLQATTASYAISECREDTLKLVSSILGDKNNHYKILDDAKYLSIEIQKEVVLTEIDSMLSEFESNTSQKSFNVKQDPIFYSAQINTSPSALKGDSRKELNRVFIVHGHDEEMKQAVARVILKLNLEAIILHEQPKGGRTIIEQFEKHSDVDYSVILLSPDDVAYPKGASPNEGKYRARQNVIMELGYFLAKLGRERVFVLYRQTDNFEIPTDYLGVLYTPYDSSGSWQYKLADELKVIDKKIDKNKL